MNTEMMAISKELEAKVDRVIRSLTDRQELAPEGLAELRAGILEVARHHAARTVHEAVTRRVRSSRTRRTRR